MHFSSFGNAQRIKNHHVPAARYMHHCTVTFLDAASSAEPSWVEYCLGTLPCCCCCWSFKRGVLPCNSPVLLCLVLSEISLVWNEWGWGLCANKGDSSSELEWQTTLCLWEQPGHVCFQVKRRLKLILHHLWSSKVSAPFAKERVFPPHCLGRIPTGSFHILPALISLTILSRCSSIPALGAQLLLIPELMVFQW